MSTNWDYAKMAKQASESGGPDQWIKNIKLSAFNEGVAYSRKKELGPAVIIASATTALVIKVIDYCVERKEKIQAEKEKAAVSEKMLLEELEKCDETPIEGWVDSIRSRFGIEDEEREAI